MATERMPLTLCHKQECFVSAQLWSILGMSFAKPSIKITQTLKR